MLESKILVLEIEKKEWIQENEKLVQRVKDLEEEAVIKNAKLLELGSMFLVPQVEFKSNCSYLLVFLSTWVIYVRCAVVVPDKEFKSFRPTIQVDNYSNNCKNKETINKENEFLKNKVEQLHEETVHLKKNIKHIKCQVKIVNYL